MRSSLARGWCVSHFPNKTFSSVTVMLGEGHLIQSTSDRWMLQAKCGERCTTLWPCTTTHHRGKGTGGRVEPAPPKVAGPTHAHSPPSF